MANEDGLYREIDRELAEDRQQAFFRQQGPLLIGAAAAVVIAVAGWQLWSARQNALAERAALDYRDAVEMLGEDPQSGRAALELLSENAPPGYAVLADMRRAGLLAAEGDREGALSLYRVVYDDGRAPQRIRQLARLRAASLSLSDGRDAVLADLGPLQDDQSVLGYYGREFAAVAALDAGDYEAAAAMFEQAAEEPGAPAPVRQRAEEFAALAAAGKAGVNIKGLARVDDLMRALGDEPGAAAPVESAAEENATNPEDAAASAEESGDEAAAESGEDVSDEESDEVGAAPADADTDQPQQNE